MKEKGQTDFAKITFILYLSSIMPNGGESCCCSNWFGHLFCGCNFFGCNCETAVTNLVREGYCRCKFSEFCPDRRRRKRSLHEPISQAYSGLFPNYLIEQAAMENFLSFDLNQDGLISLEEAMDSSSSNGTINDSTNIMALATQTAMTTAT